jgi:hypothetical protein
MPDPHATPDRAAKDETTYHMVHLRQMRSPLRRALRATSSRVVIVEFKGQIPIRRSWPRERKEQR